MTGLNLESFLHLLRADLGAWATLGLIGAVLALMAWTSWGSRRALRKCLVLSIAAHFGLALYGGSVPVVLLALQTDADNSREPERIRQIKVAPQVDPDIEGTPEEGTTRGSGSKGGGKLAAFDRTFNGLALADTKLDAARTDPARAATAGPADRAPIAAESATIDAKPPAPLDPEQRTKPEPPAEVVEKAPQPVKSGAEDVAAPIVTAIPAPETGANAPNNRLRPERNPLNVPVPNRQRVIKPLADPPQAQLRTPSVANAPEPKPNVAATPVANEPAPASASEVGDRDVAAAEVTPARPDMPRLSVGDANLRTRSRPGTGTGTGGVVAAPVGPRAPLNVEPSPARLPTMEGPVAGGPVVERPVVNEPAGDSTRPLASGENEVSAAEVERPTVAPLPRVAPPESDVRRLSRPETTTPTAPRRSAPIGELALSRVTPTGVPALPDIQGATGGRPLGDVPEIYRSRLDSNRSARAYRAGATPASEQAVERALDWLAKHQDTDGRWDGATAHYDDGTAVKGDDDYTMHCPPGEPCFGECIYWEADTALTGLALLTYLGAGYTQTDGKYAESVGKGLDFLIASQKPDGDLRGKSRAVGMYCHAMATIALCEAYALTGDIRLKQPVERAVNFIARSRAHDGMAWRYAPGEAVGDTSILGWVVMALKSAKEVGIAVPSQLQIGTLGWLGKVASGNANGLARYQPADNVTPTMTAEAWVCRQFLGVGGPCPASTEAAEYLLSHGPKSGPFNLYYWYYGTLAMYQHGGPAWTRWNGEVRDEIVRRQRPKGHAAGSWDPDDSAYGSRGGRIYCTAMATLSLEVYYRYLRLYDDPKIPPAMAPARPRNSERATDRLGGTARPASR